MTNYVTTCPVTKPTRLSASDRVVSYFDKLETSPSEMWTNLREIVKRCRRRSPTVSNPPVSTQSSCLAFRAGGWVEFIKIYLTHAYGLTVDMDWPPPVITLLRTGSSFSLTHRLSTLVKGRLLWACAFFRDDVVMVMSIAFLHTQDQTTSIHDNHTWYLIPFSKKYTN